MKTLNDYETPEGFSGITEWDNYILGIRFTTGLAARRNRGSNSGDKIHRLYIQEIIAVKDEAKELAASSATLGKRFLMNRKPVVFSVRPSCGCCQGQNAGREIAGREVTCSKCNKPLPVNA
jgi:hypothetical protein